MKRILVYSHDTYGLGNIRRMLEITRHLVDSDPQLSVLVVTGSPMIQAFRIPERVDYIKLPCVSRSERGAAGVKTLALDYASTIRMRANMILMAALDFAPDLILVDKKPLGIDDELEPMLDALSRGPRAPRVALLLRDILDEPARTRRQWLQGRYHEAIEQHVDSILVVGEAEVFDVVREYDFPPASAAKVRYCGYLARPGAHAPAERVRADLGLPPEGPLVLVTPGGGADGHRLLKTHLDLVASAEAAGQPLPFRSLLITGPEMAPGLRNDLRRQAELLPGVVLREFTADMLGCMNAADVVVCMGGYNTVCELLTLRKPAVVVPRVEPSLEQAVRADRMQRAGLFSAIHPDQLDEESLLRAITRQFARPATTPLARFEMRGLAGVERECAELIDEVATARDPYGLGGDTLAEQERLASSEALSLDTALQALTRGFARSRLGGGPAYAW
ncbi:MAG: hypothetical protein RLZZ524_792 [Pseudomonadota bacterium]